MSTSLHNDDLARDVTSEPAQQLSPVPLFSLALVVLSFFVFRFFTAPVEGMDTLRYAADAVKHGAGQPGQFWEFGHFFWRPWGLLGYTLFGDFFKSQFQDTPDQATARFLIITNFFTSLGAVVLLWDWLRRFTSNRIGTLVAIAFCGANGFLQQICMGSAYTPAIFFQILALWLLARATYTRRNIWLLSSLAGLSFALSTLLWFPFVLSTLGVVLSPILWMPPTAQTETRTRLFGRIVLPFLLLVALITVTSFSLGALANHIHSLPAFVKWVTDANNGWSQSMNLVRSATGFPRTFYELTADGVSLKRFVLHDPYHRVTLLQLLAGPLLKLAVFYAGMLALLYLLIKSRSPQRLLLVMGAAIIPLIFFAIVLFEATSTGRYLPAFAFLFLGIAVALHQAPKHSLASAALSLLLASAVISNLVELGISLSGQIGQVRTQKAQLEAQLGHPAMVLALTLHEPFYLVPISRPLDHSLWSTRYDTKDLIEPASKRVLHWRGEFAQEVLDTWKQGKEAWVPAYVYAPTPTRDSTWVEGDDKRVDWKQIRSFFAPIETDKKSGEPDGFVRIADRDSNHSLLSHIAQEDPAPAN